MVDFDTWRPIVAGGNDPLLERHSTQTLHALQNLQDWHKSCGHDFRKLEQDAGSVTHTGPHQHMPSRIVLRHEAGTDGSETVKGRETISRLVLDNLLLECHEHMLGDVVFNPDK
jgi:hypothetical protein